MEINEFIKPQTIQASIKSCQYAKKVIGSCSDCMDKESEDCPNKS